MPLCLPEGNLDGAQFDRLLAAGYRRSGWYFYRTQCPVCCACEPLRLDVESFVETRSMRRVRRLGDQHMQMQVAPPELDNDRLRVFNAHRFGRDLARGEEPTDAYDYSSFLLNSTCPVLELSFWKDGELVAISITDVAQQSLSAVYCFFDPKFSWLSPGTYAILNQITLARKVNFKWLYLGMYVATNPHLRYKSRFGPNERLVDGRWLPFPATSLDGNPK